MKTKRLASSTWMRAFLVEAWATPGPLSMRVERVLSGVAPREGLEPDGVPVQGAEQVRDVRLAQDELPELDEALGRALLQEPDGLRELAV